MKVDLISGGRVGAIAHNTFREAIRNRAFIGLGVAGLVFIMSSILMSELVVVGQGPRVVQDFGFFAISLFSVTTAVVMGALLLHKELDKKTIFTIVSKPVHRYEFVLGKYLGLSAILLLQLGVLSASWLLVLMYQSVDVSLLHFKGLVLIFFEVSVVTAVALMFSSFSTPVLTALFSGGVFVGGRVVYVIEDMLMADRGLFVDHPYLRPVGEFFAAIFPDLSVYNISKQVLLSIEVSWAYVGHALLYGLAWGLIALVIGMMAFERRDFI